MDWHLQIGIFRLPILCECINVFVAIVEINVSKVPSGVMEMPPLATLRMENND